MGPDFARSASSRSLRELRPRTSWVGGRWLRRNAGAVGSHVSCVERPESSSGVRGAELRLFARARGFSGVHELESRLRAERFVEVASRASPEGVLGWWAVVASKCRCGGIARLVCGASGLFERFGCAGGRLGCSADFPAPRGRATPLGQRGLRLDEANLLV